jgi:hypothetical protein
MGRCKLFITYGIRELLAGESIHGVTGFSTGGCNGVGGSCDEDFGMGSEMMDYY